MTTQNTTQTADSSAQIVNGAVNATPMTEEQFRAEIARLKAENEALHAVKAAAAEPKLGLKVSDKGAVSVYGMGRFPVTLYAEQWKKLLGMSKVILDFIAANESKLVSKTDSDSDKASKIAKIAAIKAVKI